MKLAGLGSSRLGPLVFTLVGGLFLLLGLGTLLLGSRWHRAEAGRFAALQPLAAAVLNSTAPGTTALLEGRISAQGRLLHGDLVAYVRQEYRGLDDSGDPVWREDERATPGLLLELPDGRAAIEPGSYGLLGPLAVRSEGEPTWDGSTGTKRYSGLTASSPVLAYGAVVAGREGPALAAEWLFAGSQDEYVASRRADAQATVWIGLLFTGLGALFGSLGVVLLRSMAAQR